MVTRYYFHGDELEEKPGQYYCAYCDSFVDENHFSKTSHSGTDKERYGRSVKGWKVLRENAKGRLDRPNDSSNLFSGLTQPKKPRSGSFYRWLVKQQDRNDPIEDLSNDAQGDRSFPIGTNSLQQLKDHLIRRSACGEAIQALEEAHAEFKGNKNARQGLSLSLRFEIFRRDDYRCQICGATATDGTRLEVDHKTPVAKGGGDEMSNLWSLCFNCNRGKGTKKL